MEVPNFNVFLSRNTESFSNCNPIVLRSNIDRILNIHWSDLPNFNGEFDFFTGYCASGISSADYYLENQIDQFYRILFFFEELRAAGIETDEDDIYEGPLPYNIDTERVQAMIYSDDSYRDYLLEERSFYEMLMSGNTRNKVVQHLAETARVCEEDLMVLRMNLPSTSWLQSTITTSSTPSITLMTTNEAMQLSKRKDVWMNKHGKCFSKRKL